METHNLICIFFLLLHFAVYEQVNESMDRGQHKLIKYEASPPRLEKHIPVSDCRLLPLDAVVNMRDDADLRVAGVRIFSR